MQTTIDLLTAIGTRMRSLFFINSFLPIDRSIDNESILFRDFLFQRYLLLLLRS